jgi:hypothetical protein
MRIAEADLRALRAIAESIERLAATAVALVYAIEEGEAGDTDQASAADDDPDAPVEERKVPRYLGDG